MNRDLIVHNLVGIGAQLRRIHALASRIKDPVEFIARIAPLVAETDRAVQSLADRINHSEGE